MGKRENGETEDNKTQEAQCLPFRLFAIYPFTRFALLVVEAAYNGKILR